VRNNGGCADWVWLSQVGTLWWHLKQDSETSSYCVDRLSDCEHLKKDRAPQSTCRSPASFFTHPEFLGAFIELRTANISFRQSVWNNSDSTGRVFMKFDLRIFLKSVDNIQVSLKSDTNNGYFTWILCTFITVSRSVLLRMGNGVAKLVKKIETHIFVSNNFFFYSHVSYAIMWKKIWYSRTGHRWQYNMAHARCMLDA
jgi:hypothetical protein